MQVVVLVRDVGLDVNIKYDRGAFVQPSDHEKLVDLILERKQAPRTPQPAASPLEALEAERDAARAEVARLQRVITTLFNEHREKAQAAYRQGFNDAVRERPPISMDLETLKACIFLCHPDRHPASLAEKANDITSLLLQIRGKT